ncbi:MAG: hypothetical protein QOF89_4786 [Acidobacteriota bacterium]|nr:hypothetical protein [Acidobacteriota bacterium]
MPRLPSPARLKAAVAPSGRCGNAARGVSEMEKTVQLASSHPRSVWDVKTDVAALRDAPRGSPWGVSTLGAPFPGIGRQAVVRLHGPSAIGPTHRRLRVSSTKVGLQPRTVGFQPPTIGLQRSPVGLQRSTVGADFLEMEPKRRRMEPKRRKMDPKRRWMEPKRPRMEPKRPRMDPKRRRLDPKRGKMEPKWTSPPVVLDFIAT